ncbi:hypothetical protein AVEN_179211-1 [Araneus ventricosus]|uniref:Uncharacterized protein n=1 Tax=Araneus ventricosus TaxID=182803 RepID=A0A4Y2C9Q3_ARAVE|nr:hypothetical protein AVEN_179211-1 [Araneus ventricosus]
MLIFFGKSEDLVGFPEELCRLPLCDLFVVSFRVLVVGFTSKLPLNFSRFTAAGLPLLDLISSDVSFLAKSEPALRCPINNLVMPFNCPNFASCFDDFKAQFNVMLENG